MRRREGEGGGSGGGGGGGGRVVTRECWNGERERILRATRSVVGLLMRDSLVGVRA